MILTNENDIYIYDGIISVETFLDADLPRRYGLAVLLGTRELQEMIRRLRTGKDEKTRIIVRNMINRNMKDEDIRAIAEYGQELIDEEREEK